MELILSMIRKVFIFSTVIALSGCFAGKHKVQALPDAELNKPYFIELRTKYAALIPIISMWKWILRIRG
ncbi:hypothetical protein HMPREF9418_2083 [Neisseria macacae ATCC 33926]|uniref:Uncharacterized protein n=1 Tax=Neisseria macacae ATCC 33926 TaxID=997348 RepID=A0AA36UHX3_9NEIS|nr:hypothetical protein HMPREF9418_2083 [Neisseria macacae ATCC 33926]